MALTASTLITKAWYLSGIVSPQLETVTGDKIDEGLDLLNSLLAILSAKIDFINFYTLYDFSLVAGQESYFIPDLVSIETVVFFIGPVRYSISPVPRRAYRGTSRVNTVTALPLNVYWTRVLGGMNIDFFPLPIDSYPAQLTGKFSITSVTLNQDLSLTLAAFFIEYLRYELADYMCAQYNVQLQGTQAAKLQDYRLAVKNISPPDMTMRKSTAFTGDVSGFQWFDTFAQGWRPV